MKATTTSERPILFSGEMVRAILDGRKTMTRRIVKPQPFEVAPADRAPGLIRFRESDPCLSTWDNACPYGGPGERLWIRETWQQSRLIRKGGGERFTVRHPAPGLGDIHYAAGFGGDEPPTWRPSIHMPRWASRITLEITGVRVERLQGITIDDIGAEGVQLPCTDNGLLIRVSGKNLIYDYLPNCFFLDKTPLDKERIGMVVKANFASTWDGINGKGSWESNPWVWWGVTVALGTPEPPERPLWVTVICPKCHHRRRAKMSPLRLFGTQVCKYCQHRWIPPRRKRQ